MERGKYWLRKAAWVVFFVLVSAPLVEATLPPGTEFTFGDTQGLNQVLSTDGTSYFTYLHTLDDGDF